MKDLISHRFIPEGSVATEFPDLNAVLYVVELGAATGELTGYGYSGKSKNPDFRYRFPSRQRLEAHVASWLKQIRDAKQARADRASLRRTAAQRGHSLKAGDIFYNSWGYDQTNIDFYQIVSATKGTVTIREIASHTVRNEGWCADQVEPVPGHFTSGPARKQVQYRNDGSAYITMDHGYTALVEPGQKFHATSYA